MGLDTFICGEQDIPLKYKPSLRAKRLSLRLSNKDASLVLTVPPRATASQIKTFLQQCTPWVEKQLQKLAKMISIKPGIEISLHGTVFQCMTDPLRRKPALCQITQTLHLPPRYKQKELHDFFKKLAGEKLTPYVEMAANAFGQSINKVTIRDTKSRWGSCSAQKMISLSWRLILAPPEVAQYVCIHEAAHLLHMNHSRAFWKTVGELCPAYRTHRKWLKANGQSLMLV